MPEAIQGLPLAGLVPVLLLICIGLILWVAGRRVLRGAFAAAGLVLGAGGGLILAHTIGFGVPDWTVAVLVGLGVACLAALVYRLAVAAGLAMLLAVGAPAAFLALAEAQGRTVIVAAPDSEPTEASPAESFYDDANEWLRPRGERRDAPSVETSAEDPAAPALSPGAAILREHLGLGAQADEALGHVQGYTERVMAAARDLWERVDPGLRPGIVGSAVGGILIGLLLGTLASSLSASVLSSFGGALLWLSGLRVLLAQAGESLDQWLPDTAGAALILWLITSLIGVGIQWMFRPKPADTPG